MKADKVGEKLRLMIPGPVEVRPEVLAVMSAPIRPHYGNEWTGIFNATIGLAKQVFQTANDLFLLPGSGTAALEAAMSSLAQERYTTLVLSNGWFGEHLARIARAYSDQVRVEPFDIAAPIPPAALERILSADRSVRVVAVVHCETSTGVMNPLEDFGAICAQHKCVLIVDAISSLGGLELRTDEWLIDVCISASQKALEAPPGLSLVTVSDKAWELIESNKKQKGWYLNLSTWKTYAEAEAWKDWHPSPVTMPVNNILALRESLLGILAEGLEKRFARHTEVASDFREAMRKIGLEPFAGEEFASNTVTAVQVPAGIGADQIKDYLVKRHHIVVAGGVRPLANRVFRVGHMGPSATLGAIRPLVQGVKDAVQNFGGMQASTLVPD